MVLQKNWEGVLGRYDRAVQQLMVEVLNEPQNPVEKLVQALSQNALTAEARQRAIETIPKGYFIHTI